MKEVKLESEESSSLSCFILAVSLLLVSENWLAITTRQRLIMKNVPILLRQSNPPWVMKLYYDENNEVDKVVERVNILYQVHHICPALQRYHYKYRHPGQP